MKIQTSLIDRKEIFDALMVAYLTGVPILLQGPPGTAKTQAARDFAKSINGTIFETQLSFGTRPSEIKGVLDIPKLMQGVQETICPIANAEVIIIDEVDKGSSEIRNTLLSIMRERELFLGSEGNKKCKWKLFVGTVNEIPQDETNSPFWDRFVIKHPIDRINASFYGQMWKGTVAEYNYPDEINNNIAIDHHDSINSIAKVLEPYVTDRTISYLPHLINGVHTIHNIDIIDSCIKTGSLIRPEFYDKYVNELANGDYSIIRSGINNIVGLKDSDLPKETIEKIITSTIKTYNSANTTIQNIFKGSIESIKLEYKQYFNTKISNDLTKKKLEDIFNSN